MYEALSSRLSLAHSRIATGLAGALNRLSLGPAADRRQSAQRVSLTSDCPKNVQLKLKEGPAC